MAEVLEDILNDINKTDLDDKILAFKDHIKSLDILEIMFPTGVKKVSKYRDKRAKPFDPPAKGTPVHVKSAINYNDMLKYHNVRTVREIINGEKIKWTYLKSNPMNLNSLALKGFEDPEVIVDFVKQYINHDKIFKSAFENKLNDFYQAMNWGKVPENNNLGKFFGF